MLLIRTQVQSQQTAESIAAIEGHLEAVKGSTPVSPDELQLAKDMLTLSLPLEWETDEGIANAIATSVRRGLPDGAIEKYVVDVRAITKEQVEQAARQILRPDAMIWLIIGDRSKVEPELKKAGIAYKVLTPGAMICEDPTRLLPRIVSSQRKLPRHAHSLGLGSAGYRAAARTHLELMRCCGP